MNRTLTRSLQVAVDLTVLSVALWSAFLLRFDWDIPLAMQRRALTVWPWVVAVQYLALWGFRVPRIAWRYVGLRDAVRILAALTASAVVFSAVRGAVIVLRSELEALDVAVVPLGVTAIDFVLGFLAISGVRVARRLAAERSELARTLERVRAAPTTRVILVGAGQGGMLVAKELLNRPDLNRVVVGFVDDDPLKAGTMMLGVPVLGSIEELPQLVSRRHLDEAIITISNAPGEAIRRISERCRDAGLTTKILPGLHDLVDGRINLAAMRDVAIEDLLRRETVKLDEEGIGELVRGRVMLVTGAGGSIGSELCRQLLRFEPSRLVLVERTENALFEIHRELAVGARAQVVVPCIADITDEGRMETLLARFRPAALFHAAAHKHVPMMERDAAEAVKNNVLGTVGLAKLAERHEVDVFVMVSTDKAVNPTSVMGATKRTAEMYIQALSKRSRTRFVTVRFGNVLGSSGSVIPIFRQQIAAGGPVTVTHPEMQRYFMTIPEASQLVVQAGSMGQGGEIFVLDMGEPVKIVDMARDLIRLSGFSEADVPIVFTGTRPGEKLFEELSLQEEHAERTHHPKVFVGKTREWDLEEIEGAIERLRAVVEAERRTVVAALQSVVPEYSPAEALPADAQGPAVEPSASASSTGRSPVLTPLPHRA